MEIGVVGKPNVGKSTFFSACTLATAEIASYPFTTIDPNKGVAYVRTPCPHTEFNIECNPRNSKCENGTRLVPIQTIDVAGLVPDAHKGKGLGNQFLDDLRQAHALIHIIDASGGTDLEGNPCDIGTHDPLEDVRFLEEEITYWIKGIITKNWAKVSKQLDMSDKKLEKALAELLTGLRITEGEIYSALKSAGISERPSKWSDDELIRLADEIRKASKPMILAANKADIAPEENIKRLKELKDYIVIPTSAESELALRKAAKSGLIEYTQGSNDFKIVDKARLNEKQINALEHIRTNTLQRYGSTGVQKCIEEAVFNLLDLIVVYPVEDENKLTDKEGRILPDAYLLKRGSTARDLAYKVHTELGEHFIRAIDVRSKRVIGADYELKENAVITIKADA